MEELHLFIIWENALDKKNIILKDIEKNFKIVKKYMVKWSEDKFSENLSRFYGTSLPQGSGKEQHCGTGPFMLIIVKDTNPIYETRSTSRGEEIVNINMFDKKTYYRELTGGGHKIHATNNELETNHDITLLLHQSIEDFLKQEYSNTNVEKIEQDLIGARGWKNASQMFYALNNCTNYAILRNYESLPEEIYVNEHNDIDLICESKENCAYVLNAKKVFNEEYRVHYVTDVEGKKAYFDLRFLGDNYYCERLERKILERKIFNEKGFFTIDNEFYFYTLLYHAMLHKKTFAEDYKKRLIGMNVEKINENTSNDEFSKILEKWLIENDYRIITPIDISVQFNLENANKILQDRYLAVVNQNKKNIINWYPFKEKDKILEISSNEDKVEHKNIINIFDIKEIEKVNSEKFDYILLIGKLKEASEQFEILLENLKENGKILLVENNRDSVKNICIENRVNNLYSLKQIEELLSRNGLNYRKNYYVLQDYKTANVIFTDKHLPNKETINRNLTFYKEENIVTNNENKIYKEILKLDNNLFKLFVNSYFIECSRSEFEDNGIEFVSFANIRKEKYQIQTIIKDENVYKTFANEFAKNHIELIKKNIDIMNKQGINTLDSYNENEIISNYQKDKETFEEYLLKQVEENKMENAKQLIKDFYNELKEKLEIIKAQDTVLDKYKIKYDEENMNNLTFIKYGLWDLLFQNAFYIDGNIFFYDQEWFEENVPLEFILYRSYKYSERVQAVFRKELFYEIIGINNKNVEIFDLLDNCLQERTRNENNWNIHANPNYVEKAIKNINEQKEQMRKEAVQLLIQKDSYIKQLEDMIKQINNDNEIKIKELERQIEEKQATITYMENSRVWKLSKTLRKIKGNK